jgi:nickel/cobalt transporter (NicO) family protein
MLIIVASAFLVGMVHSLAPGHWLPVVLMTKARKWDLRVAALGAFVAALGHIFVSIFLGIIGVLIGSRFIQDFHELEEYSGWVLIVFGICYAIFSWNRHATCHGHTHHGPAVRQDKAPFLFLFSLGLSPCFAVLPVFAAAIPMGSFSLVLTMVSFAVGVITALVGGTLLVSLGLIKLDHPILEHYGDVITGVGVAAMGILLLFLPHTHDHL